MRMSNLQAAPSRRWWPQLLSTPASLFSQPLQTRAGVKPQAPGARGLPQRRLHIHPISPSSSARDAGQQRKSRKSNSGPPKRGCSCPCHQVHNEVPSFLKHMQCIALGIASRILALLVVRGINSGQACPRGLGRGLEVTIARLPRPESFRFAELRRGIPRGS